MPQMSPATLAASVVFIFGSAYLIFRAFSRHEDGNIPNSTTRCRDAYPEWTSREAMVHARGPGGRFISWSEYGPVSGKPIFFLHGLPGSRIIPVPGLRSMCLSNNIRLIAIEGPGIGRTSLPPQDDYNFNTGILPTASSDLVELIAHLGINRDVHIIGYSMGCPRALAFAAWVNDQTNNDFTLTRMDLIAPIGFTSSPHSLDGVAPPNRVAHFLARHAPKLLRLAWHIGASSIVKDENYADSVLECMNIEEKRYLMPPVIGGTKKDEPSISGLQSEWPQLQELWRATTAETWRQGVDGFVENVCALFGKDSSKGWDLSDQKGSGFDLGQLAGLSTTQVHFWHGRNDTLTPLFASKELATLMKIGQVHEMEEKVGHFAILREGLFAVFSALN